MTPSYNEREVLALLQEESTQKRGFEMIVTQYSEQLYWQIRRMVLSHEDANDLLQNTFIKAWINIDYFRAEAKLSTWLYRIALNECLTFLNKQRAASTVSLDDPEADALQKLESDPYFSGDKAEMALHKALLTANTNVSLAMNADIKVERSANTTDRQDEITAYPIEYEDVALYNPTNGFAAFLIPAVLVLIIQQTLLLGIGLSAGTAREQNRFRDLVPINRHYNGTLRIVMGKGLSYFMVYSLVSVYILCVVPWLFSLNQIAIPGVLTLFTLPYLAACIFFAMTASIAIRNRETCMLLFVFTSVPLLFLSGISWPGAAMPAFWKYFSYIFPSTFGINGYVRINSMGATLNEVSFEYQALWIQTGFYFITTCLVYRWQILQSRKHVIEEYKKHKSIEA